MIVEAKGKLEVEATLVVGVSKQAPACLDTRLPRPGSSQRRIRDCSRTIHESCGLEASDVEEREARIPGVLRKVRVPTRWALCDFILPISFAPAMFPSYAVAFLLIAYSSVVQHEVEEVAKQEL